jgi:uncharacterized protein YukE
MADLVPNPMYEALSKLYTQLQADAPTMSDALKPADQQMQAGQTWVGPTGQGWGSQLDGYSRDCATQVSGMLSDVAQQMQATPQQVSQADAQVIRKQMQLMRYN